MKRKMLLLFLSLIQKDKFEGFLVDFTATSGITKEKFAFWQTKTFNVEDRKLVKNNEFSHNGQLKHVFKM